jgi:hypothetical protein
MKALLRSIFQVLRHILFVREADNSRLIVVTDLTSNTSKVREIEKRIDFFIPNIIVVKVRHLTLHKLMSNEPVAFVGAAVPTTMLKRAKLGRIFNLDFETNPDDGWQYHRILSLFYERLLIDNRNKSKNKLAILQQGLSSTYDKVYILGTGPSLDKAIDRDWSDGIRIVSNTIVKDKELWAHINPHFIVAGDAIYHFGLSQFATSFREDLKQRLSESKTYFVFPEHFYPFLSEHLKDFIDRLIPIPMRTGQSAFNIIKSKFEIPEIGNVLNNLLLPLGCYVSDNIFLWGFDGRAPDDKLFWKNSDKHFYPELVQELQQLHPAFFDAMVPKNNPSLYVQSVHGDLLDQLLVEGEENGKTFTMMHSSYTPTLMKRFRMEN